MTATASSKFIENVEFKVLSILFSAMKKFSLKSFAARSSPQSNNNISRPESLPILKYRDEIIREVNKNHVTIISAATGSGKTTQVPQFILDDAVNRNDVCRMLISQPRKIAASTVAQRVAAERNCELGGLVGYQIGLEKMLQEDYRGNRLVFCTTGVILQKMIQEKSMMNYSHLILDEIHEREIDMDLLMTVVREFLLHNSGGTKLILMSATLDAEIFANYFTFCFDSITVKPGIIKLKVERHFKIEKLYLDDLRDLGFHDDIATYSKPGITSNMYQVAKKIISERLKSSKKSILVFLPGILQIEAMHAVLKEETILFSSCLICVLHSSLSTADQRAVFRPADKPKIILSTNIAESSVTITDIDCVIDFCLSKIIVASRDSTMSSLQLDWAAKDSLEQRAGRTGRTCDGIVYRLIHHKFYDDRLQKFSTPEMERCPLETVVLRVKLLDIESPVTLLSKALSSPEPSAITRAVLVLKELGGLQRISDDGSFIHNDGKLTYVGRVMAALPLDVRVTKLVILGYVYSVLSESIIIAAGLTIKSIFRNSFCEKLDDYTHKLAWANSSGCDFIAILNAYKFWKLMSEQGHFVNVKAEKTWCDQHNLELKSLHEMRDLIREIHSRLAKVKMESLYGELGVTWEEKEKPLILKICIAGAFIPNFYICGESNELLEQEIYKELCGKSPYNTVIFKNMDNKYIGEVYEEPIKQKLIEMGICRDHGNIEITFEKGSSKFLVEFDSKDEKIEDGVEEIFDTSLSSLVPGKTAPEVYKAIKLRKLGYRFKLDVMSSDETEAYAMQHGLVFDNNGFLERKKNVMKHPELCVLPLTCAFSLQGVVTEISSCGKFYIQPLTPTNSETIRTIHDLLLQEASEAFQSVEELARDQLVAVLHESSLKRAKVLSTTPRMVQCLLFDYGTIVKVPIDHVFKSPEKFFEISERCFEAKLSEIEPSFLKCPSGKWTSQAVKEFRSLALHREVKVEVFSVVSNIASVKLWIDNLCVNEEMIEAEFAQECEESFPSKHNHQMRSRIQALPSMWYGPEVEFVEYRNRMTVKHIPPPPKSKCNKSLHLSGPHSPLETSLTNILLNSRSTDIAIDPLSVNSVVLYDNPANIYGRLMVAANVTKSKGKVTLRETTMLPDIPGLSLLLGMIFAPDVIFRRNEDRTKYKNMQFGLGCYKKDSSPLFPEHDCILPVNFQFDDKDFYDVNYLRFLMSHLLTTEPNEQISSLTDEEKSNLMGRVKDQVIKILSKNREPLNVTYASRDINDWTTEDQSDSRRWKDIFIGGGSYHHIVHPPLVKESSRNAQKLIEEVAQLQSQMRS